MVAVKGETGTEPRAWVGIPPAVALGVMQTGSVVAIATLVFNGSAASHLGRAITGFLVGSVLVCAIVAWRTSFGVVVAGARNNITVVVAAVAAGVADSAGSAAPITVAVFVMIAVLSSGALTYLMGRFHLGYLVRFVPYPVMGGYVAGTAWPMIRGGVSVSLNSIIDFREVGDLFQSDLAKFWLPALALGVIIAFTPGATRQSLIVIGSIVAFHVAVGVASTVDEVEADGWFIGPFVDTDRISVIEPSEYSGVDWGALASGLPGLPAIALITIVGLLLNITGVEFVTGERIDLDRELRASGAATVGSALAGGTIGFLGIGQSLLARRLGASSKLVAGAFAAVAAITIMAGPEIVGLMPRWVAGGLVMGPGIALMRTWIRDSVLRGSLSDRVLTVVIPLTVAFFGVLAGVGLGVVIAASLFVWRYARLDPVRHRTSGAVLRSSLDRSSGEAATLDSHGGEIVAMRLEGYLFFGSAARIGEKVRTLLDEQQDLRHVILDLFHVSGIDSSAQVELHELAKLACDQGVLIQYACAPESLVKSFEDSTEVVGFASDLDHALEVAEEDLLASADLTEAEPVDPLAEVGANVIDRFTEVQVASAEVLMSAGQTNAGLFLVAEGTLTVWAPVVGVARRLRRVGPGAYLGEVGFFAGEPATATVIADGPARVLRLSHEEFEKIRTEEPDLALELIQQVLAVTAHRLNLTNALVGDLLR